MSRPRRSTGDVFVPAAGQGCLAVQARAGDVASRLSTTPPRTRRCVAERAVVARLDASCHTPVGVHSRALDGLVAFVGLAGRLGVADRPGAPMPEQLAERMLAAGAADLLARAAAMA